MSFYSGLKGFLKPITKFLFRTKAQGFDNVPEEGPVIIAGNHTFLMDPVFVGIYTKRDITFMAKAELCDAPVLGWVMKKLNVVRLQRDGSDISAVRAVLGALKNDSCISLFPQGTRCRYHAPLREEMKDGVSFLAMQSKAPVVPVGIYMKGFCGGLFKKTYISFGKPIVPADSIPRGAKNIGLATDMIYEAICKEVAEAQAMAEKK